MYNKPYDDTYLRNQVAHLKEKNLALKSKLNQLELEVTKLKYPHISMTVSGYDWLLRNYAIKSYNVECLLVGNKTIKFVCEDFYIDYTFADNEWKEYVRED